MKMPMIPFYNPSQKRKWAGMAAAFTAALFLATAALNPVEAQSRKALKFFDEGRYEPAIRILKKDFYADQNDLESGLLLAEALYKTHQYEEALDALNLVSTERMTRSKDLLLYADVLIANDDFSAAYLALIEWLSISETDADAYLWLDKTANLLAWDSLRTRSEIAEIEGLNTYANEYAPYTAPNGDLWFISDINSLQAVFPGAFTNQNVHLYHRTSPSHADSLKMNKPSMLMKLREYYYHDGALTQVPEQDEYALTLREIDGLQYALKTGIYFSHLTGAEDDIRPFEHNGKFNTGHPTFSPDGTRMYFASDRDGGFGGMDLWYSDLINGSWSEPVNMGRDVNTPGNEVYPAWHDFRLFYASDRRDMGYGGLDLYYISLLNRPFKPINLRTPINTAYDDFSVHFTRGTSGFLASNRIGGAGGDDIFAMHYVPEQLPIDTVEFKIMPVHPGEVAVAVYDLSGVKIASEKPDEHGVVTFTNLSTAAVYRVEVEGEEGREYSVFGTDALGNEFAYGDGKSGAVHVEMMDNAVQRFVRPETVYADNSASALAASSSSPETADLSESNAVLSFPEPIADAAADKAGGWKAESQKGSPMSKLTAGMEYLKSIPNVYYDFDRYHLREDAKSDLDDLAAALLADAEIHLKVISHTDSRGPDAYNQVLSEKRARSVIDYLLSKGVTADRMTSEGRGESDLANECADGIQCSNEDHAKNRRTEFVFKRVTPPKS